MLKLHKKFAMTIRRIETNDRIVTHAEEAAQKVAARKVAALEAETLSVLALTPDNILWGEPVGGLRLGIRPADYAKRKDRFRNGDWMRYEVWIKNESADVIRIPRDPRDRAEPAIDGKDINLLGDRSSDSFSIPAEELEKATISVSPGEVGFLESPQAPIYAADGPTRRYGSSPLRLAPGKYGTHAIRDVYYLTKDSHGNVRTALGLCRNRSPAFATFADSGGE